MDRCSLNGGLDPAVPRRATSVRGAVPPTAGSAAPRLPTGWVPTASRNQRTGDVPRRCQWPWGWNRLLMAIILKAGVGGGRAANLRVGAHQEFV